MVLNHYTLIFSLANLLVLTGIYLYLCSLYSKRQISIWTVAWLLGSLLYIFDLLTAHYSIESLPVQVIAAVLALAVGLLILNYASEITENKISKIRFALFSFLLVSVLAAVISNKPDIIHGIPYLLFICSIFVCSITLLQRRFLDGFNKYITGWTIILWSAIFFNHSLPSFFAWHTSWGYILVSLLFLFTAISMLIIHLQRLRTDLINTKKILHLLAKNAHDLVYRYRLVPELGFEYISPAATRITGYAPEEFYHDPELSLRLIHSNQPHLVELLRHNPEKLDNSYIINIKHKTQGNVWLDLRSEAVFNKKGNIIALEGVARDITETKETEAHLRYLNWHDSLTGLYNRSYFEQRLHQKSTSESTGIIVCDVDGLKMINDMLGHTVGDEVLIEAGRLIKSCFRENDFIARIGGDEFAIIMTNCNKQVLEKSCQRIEAAIVRHNLMRPELTIHMSIGYSYSSDRKTNIFDLFKHADNKMYRRKLKRNNVARIAIVNALTNAIAEKDFTTEGHSRLISEIVEDLAEAMGLTEEITGHLRQLALFHDIGKIGIPDSIIFKPGPLNQEEMMEVQKHCEIGYRIARSTPELAPIADFILKHHERWDGTGYPLGIKGEEIPLECRILSIVDAYDAMVSDRPYRKALTHEAAIAEIIRCSGTQFDPKLAEIFIDTVKKHTIE